MTPKFIDEYHPLTAWPFLRNEAYEEHIPCKPLRPYVACFWSSEGMEKSGADGLVRVIPDTCMDIIIDINYTKQTIKSKLCGIQDYAVMVEQGNCKEGNCKEGNREEESRKEGNRKEESRKEENRKEESRKEESHKEEIRRDTITRFAVRFPFWAARRFFDLDMSGLCNQSLDLELLKPGCNEAFEALFYCRSLEERIAWMESYLPGIFDPEGYNPDLYNCIEYLLRSKGRAPVRDICGHSAVSQRQLERLFKQEIGISIKRTASLVRYQNVWREVIQQNQWNIQEAVGRYGYADQSHLLGEFKRFHGLYPSQAKQEALERR